MQKVWVEGLVKALPDPLIATGTHRYQGERRGIVHKGSGNLVLWTQGEEMHLWLGCYPVINVG